MADAIMDDSNEDEPFIHISELNEEYRYGMIYDDLMWASKNAKEWVLALAYGMDSM